MNIIKKNKIIKISSFIAFLIITISSTKVQASEVKEQINGIIDNQIELYNYNNLDGIINKSYSDGFSTSSIIKDVLTGNVNLSFSNTLKMIESLLFKEMRIHIHILKSVILIGLASAFINTLTESLKSKGASELSFYVMYISIITLLITSFEAVYIYTTNLIDQINEFTLNSVPIIVGSLFISGNPNSAILAQPLLISMSYMLITIFQRLILPFIFLTFVAEIFNNLAKKEILNGFIYNSKKLIKYSIKGITIVFISLISLFRLSTPVSDGIVKKILQSSLNVIPIVGSTISSGLDTVMYFSDAFKTGLTVALIIGVILISFYYIANILIIMVIYTYASIVIEPICDNRIFNAFKTLQSHIGFLLSVLASVLLMFIVSISLILSI